MKTKLIAILLLVQLLYGCGGGTGVIAKGTFGSILDDMSNQVNLFIQHAQSAGLILEVNGGAQVLNLITQAKDAYKESLNTTINTMTGEQQKLVSDINGVFEKVQGGVTDIAGQIETIVNTAVPFEKFPQVRTYNGTIIAPNDSSNIFVQLKGNFYDIANTGYEAVLKIGNKNYKSILKTTPEIRFSIPAFEFSAAKNKIDYKPFTIDINYKKKSFLIFSSKKVATFNLYFVVLPEKFGTYTLETKKLVNSNDSVWTQCGPYDWNTHDNNDHDETLGCSVTPGWTIQNDSVWVEFTRKENQEGVDWFNRGNASTSTAALWHFYATTRHKTFGVPTGNYGGVTVNIHYKQYKPSQAIKTITTPEEPIQWGDEKVLFIEPGLTSWKLSFKQFDGKIKEIASSNQQSPYIKVSTSGNQLELKLAPFSF